MTIKDIKKKKKAQLFKVELILKYGGKCCKCGYNNNLCNLCFHHINPNNKLFGIDMHAFTHKSRKKILNEVIKCELLCHHCHNDFHHPEGLDWKKWDI